MAEHPDGAASAAEPAAVDVLDFEAILDQWKPHTVDATITVDPTVSPPTTAVITFQAIGNRAWEALKAAHPPTDEQQGAQRQEQLDRGVMPSKIQKLRWNPDTFPPALIAASAVSPKITPDQARRLWVDDKRNPAELDKLFSAALLANESAAQVRLGKDWETILDSVNGLL